MVAPVRKGAANHYRSRSEPPPNERRLEHGSLSLANVSGSLTEKYKQNNAGELVSLEPLR
jgi:hypothetical protein